MTIEEAIRAHLLTLTAVTAITSTIRPGELQQSDALPAITIGVKSKKSFTDLSGKGGLVSAILMVSSISSRESGATGLAEAIRVNGTDPGTGLAGFRGTAGSLQIHATLTEDAVNYYAYEDGKDAGFFACEAIYDVMYSETV